MDAEFLSRLVASRMRHNVIAFFYREFKRLGLERVYADFLEDIPEELRGPLFLVYQAHVTKEKALLTYAMCQHVTGDVEKAKVLGFAVDLLWLLSLIQDDITDQDESRAGITASWKQYGVENCEKAMKVILQALLLRLSKVFGAEVAANCMRLVNISLKSLEDHKHLLRTCTLEEVLENYRQRSAFHDQFAVEAMFVGEKDNQMAETLALAMISLNQAGQILNDLKDFRGAVWFNRKSFTDVRSGLVTFPLVWLYSRLHEEDKPKLEAIFGTDSEETPVVLRELTDSYLLLAAMYNEVSALYNRCLRNVEEVMGDSPYFAYFLLWYQYKMTQLVEVCLIK